MRRDDWWKNFGLGMELDAAGVFIYNGLKTFDSLDGLNQPIDIFEVLYNLSVGIERLLKVAIILVEHNDETSMEEFEASLMTHNTMDLANRVGLSLTSKLGAPHKEFLSLLSKFYKSHRYGRFSFSCVPDIGAEKHLFLKYLNKNIDIDIEGAGPFFFIHNTNKIKKFLGKVVKKITGTSYEIIQRRTQELNIYTHELRGDSKSVKVFLGLDDRLDFIDEDQVKREILLFLMSPDVKDERVDLIRSFGSIDLEPEYVPIYIKVLLNDVHVHLVHGEVECLYEELDDVFERFDKLSCIDKDFFSG